jgi:hypothetical protein
MENLLLKAQQNKEIGDMAFKKSFYDIAVSRLYYELYQKIIYISKNKGIEDDLKAESSSHGKYIQNFIQGIHIKMKLAAEQMDKLNNLHILKRQRNTSDYMEDYIDNIDDYNSNFYTNYFRINNVIDNILEKL